MSAPVSLNGQRAFRWRPGRLWSLWEMLKELASDYVTLGSRIEEGRFLFIMATDMNVALTEDDLCRRRDTLVMIRDLCRKLGLTTAEEVISQHIGNGKMPETLREYDILVSTAEAELRRQLFLFVPGHLARYYDVTLALPVTEAFPIASREIITGGNCLAAGFYTASVFHCMRAAEMGLRVLAKTLNVVFPDRPLELAEWQNLIEQSEKKIREMEGLKPRVHKEEELNWYSQAAAQFRYFKDGYRVRVAHARETCDEPTAVKVLTHTIEFFETLSSRLKEE